MAVNSGILIGTNLVCLQPAAKNAYREIGVAWRPTSYKQQSYQLLSQLTADVLTVKCKS